MTSPEKKIKREAGLKTDCAPFSSQIWSMSFHSYLLVNPELTGTSGIIYSYNYAGSYHLINQQYDNCIRYAIGSLLIFTAVTGILSLQDRAGLLQHFLHCRHTRDQWTA